MRNLQKKGGRTGYANLCVNVKKQIVKKPLVWESDKQKDIFSLSDLVCMY